MNATNNLALRAYENFGSYKKAMDFANAQNNPSADDETAKNNGLFSRKKAMQNMISSDKKYKQLETVDYYVDLVKGIING
tara:strand:- start:1267 stop:1506 length:240 start_codon:yes stop_codon:yes gene_type:complete